MTMRHSLLRALMTLTLIALAAVPAVARPEATVEARDAWVLKAPPVVKMHAGYLTLTNRGAAPRALVAVSSPAYGRIDMHLAQTVGGVATMQPVAQVALQPGETVRFEPGGLHLMLMMPAPALAEAASVTLRLTFDDGSEVEIAAALRDAAPPAGGMDHSGHGGMDAGS